MIQVKVRKIMATIAMSMALSLPSTVVLGQLSEARWDESVLLTSGFAMENHSGSNENQPEPLFGTIRPSNAEVSAAVTFSSPGPPNATSTASVALQGTTDGVGAVSYCVIGFEFKVREIVAPPVPVDTVPVRVHASGSASATGPLAFAPLALATLSVYVYPASPHHWAASADYTQPSIGFNEATELAAGPGTVNFALLNLSASASADYLQNSGSALATARINPTFEVANRLIPGTNRNYRECFAIDFSPGYWALGQNPQAIEPTTWGKIKAAYR